MKYFSIIISLVLLSCSDNQNNELVPSNNQTKVDTVKIIEYRTDTVLIESVQQDYYFIAERLPSWFTRENILQEDLTINEKYKFDSRLNPLYLEADFNCDEILDLAIPILNKQNEKKGIAVIHGGINKITIIGAGTKYKNGMDDDIGWYNIWFVNRNSINPPGVDATEPLLLDNPSIQIEKSEVGGGQLFWNGQEYEYFHQTC